MPNIDSITPVLYSSTDPYHVEFDNLPLKNILDRQLLINFAVDINTNILRQSQGTQGSLSNRLNKSIEDNGDIKTTSIDNAFHNIAFHEDGQITIDSETFHYVRMRLEERAKLDLIADEATSLRLKVETISTDVFFDNVEVTLQPSDTITWEVVSPNKIEAHTTFPTSFVHRHYYDIVPLNTDSINPDYQNFKVNSLSSPFIEGTLRIYINGNRISENEEIYVPNYNNTELNLITFTSDPNNGTFTLSAAIDEQDVIIIDYDQDFS